MPTILLTKGYRLHIEKNRSTAKFFLKNTELAKSKRFNAKELSEIRNIIVENLTKAMKSGGL